MTYVTAGTESNLLPQRENLTVVKAACEGWTANLDLELALRVARGEAEWQVRVDLVTAACDASERFFNDENVRLLLRSTRFDVAVVDGGALCNHLLADALHPVPQVHYLCYPPHHPFESKKEEAMYTSAIQRRVGTRLQALRASVGAPPKPQCQQCHVLTIVGHSHVFVRRRQLEALPLGAACCVGSVLSSGPAPSLPPELASWADASGASGGFVLVCMGSWADEACTRLGKDITLLEALRELGLPTLWKTAAGARGELGKASGELGKASPAATPVRFASWLPQRALLAHPNCRLLVCHGGANSMSEAAACGVPIVALAVAWDQPQNGARAEELQIGRCVPLARCSPEALLVAMRAQLDDPASLARSRAIADVMRESDTGAEGAASLIERAVEMATEMRSEEIGAEVDAPSPWPSPQLATEVHGEEMAFGWLEGGATRGHDHVEKVSRFLPRRPDGNGFTRSSQRGRQQEPWQEQRRGEEESGWGDDLD